MKFAICHFIWPIDFMPELKICFPLLQQTCIASLMMFSEIKYSNVL